MFVDLTWTIAMSKNKMDVFQLKADFLPITVLQMLKTDADALQTQLESITKQAPRYFENAPVLMDFTSIGADSLQPDLEKLCAVLREHHMQPIAARGVENNLILPVIPNRAAKKDESQSPQAVSTTAETVVIDKPIRAGTQIYAKDADLIVLSSVNAGAEIIADGHIHVYGPLRGRALAGASGNENARIFCRTLEAELIAIAGHYLVNEKIKMPKSKYAMLQIFLEAEQLQIKTI